jgi:hypothetical protein
MRYQAALRPEPVEGAPIWALCWHGKHIRHDLMVLQVQMSPPVCCAARCSGETKVLGARFYRREGRNGI